MALIPASKIPTLTTLYTLNKLSPPTETSIKNFPKTLLGPKTLPTPSQSLNDRVALHKGDITTLSVDAIVNAANRSLLGGGGVDGAIHRAAGDDLYHECKKLKGCETGSAKITNAYRLPCQKVIHAVGPVYDRENHETSEKLLTGCYTKSLELAAENGCRTIAFSAISTGIYGYPSNLAAPAALSAIRKFLEEDTERKISKVIIVTFVQNDVNAYNQSLPLFFPPVTEEKKEVTKSKEEEEAEAIAKKLPDVPTTEPAEDTEHVEKKHKAA